MENFTSNRRKFVKTLSLASSTMFWPFPKITLPNGKMEESPIRMIIDADTANEVDDLFAIARALIEPAFKIEGLTSAQWHTQERAPNDTVGLSQQLNEEILTLMGLSSIPHPMGANNPLVNLHRPQASAAAEFIIEQAHKTPEGEKLTVITLGPNTNLASAVLMDPTIIPKLKCCYLGFWHHPEENTWNKREFNTNNDPNATDLLLNTIGLEFHIMTASTSKHLVFEKSEVDKQLKGKGKIGDYLINRWETYDRFWQKTDTEKKKWIMWDVAIIEALAHPNLAKTQEVVTPHDNRLRKISAYTWIDAAGMKERYWATFRDYFTRA